MLSHWSRRVASRFTEISAQPRPLTIPAFSAFPTAPKVGLEAPAAFIPGRAAEAGAHSANGAAPRGSLMRGGLAHPKV
jgi:hypothetical protein